MKTQIIFGSQSDESIYNQFASALRKIHMDPDVKVLSAHRNPKELKELLSHLPPQPIIAGAGLAAHLPGVVASLVSSPVFGIPVQSQFKGLDAFLSIAQMPKGVPVACTFHVKDLTAFLLKKDFSEKIFSSKTADSNCDLKDANIFVASLEEHAETEFTGLRVLWLGDEEKNDPAYTLKWHALALQKGLWLGVNRLENAILFLHKMRGVL